MTERHKRLKDELKRFNNLLEQTRDSSKTLLSLLAEDPPIIPLIYSHAVRDRLNTLLPRDALDALQKELNKVHGLFKQDD